MPEPLTDKQIKALIPNKPGLQLVAIGEQMYVKEGKDWRAVSSQPLSKPYAES